MTVRDLLNQCDDAYCGKDYERLIGLCNEILKEDLNNQIALGYKAEGLHLLGKCEESLTLLDNAIRVFPDNCHYLRIKADVLADKEEYVRAIECYERIFEIGADETALSFIRQDYEVCLDLQMDCLIEEERYAKAWECYNKKLAMDSSELKRSQAINEFKRYVSNHTSRAKCRQYYVRISSDEAKRKLVGFLDENGFDGNGEPGLVFLIDVVDKSYSPVSIDEIGSNSIISESKFYDKVNCRHKDHIVHKRISDESGNMLFEGYTLNDFPYGFGTAYFADGTVYREGIFDLKGIVQGREYYPSGQLRFEGQWCVTSGYGPNAPCEGDAYSEEGELIYSGKFEIRRRGRGWPKILNPKGFPIEQKERPKIEYYRK